MRRHSPAKPSCPRCGSDAVYTTTVQEQFEFGEGTTRQMVSATIPILHCESCRGEFESADTFAAKHDAVCDHLGLLRPSQVKELRKQFGSRESFASATGIGAASIARWESGALIQSSAYDRYMRLLVSRSNKALLNSLGTSDSRYRFSEDACAKARQLRGPMKQYGFYGTP